MSEHQITNGRALSVDDFIATFRYVGNGIIGTTTAKIHSVEQHDDGVIEVVIDHWPQSQELLRRVLEILEDACQVAMEQTMKARIPECGEFSKIAQDLSFVITTLREQLS